MVLLIDPQVAFVSAGGEKIDGPSGGRLMIRMALEFFFEFFDNLFPMLSLPFGLTGIVAQDIPAPEFAIAYDYLLRLEIFGNRSKTAGSGEHLFLNLGNAGHAGSQKVLPTGPGQFIAVRGNPNIRATSRKS